MSCEDDARYQEGDDPRPPRSELIPEDQGAGECDGREDPDRKEPLVTVIATKARPARCRATRSGSWSPPVAAIIGSGLQESRQRGPLVSRKSTGPVPRRPSFSSRSPAIALAV